MGPWAHWPMDPLAHGTPGPWAHGPWAMGPPPELPALPPKGRRIEYVVQRAALRVATHAGMAVNANKVSIGMGPWAQGPQYDVAYALPPSL